MTSRWRRWAPAMGLSAAIGAVGLVWSIGDGLTAGMLHRSVEDVREAIEAWGAWAAFGSVSLMVLHSVLPLPGELIAIANGMLFGPVWGTVITWIGAMIGAALSFGAARYLAAPIVARGLSREHADLLADWRSRPGILLLVRLVPIISFNLINYGAGAAGVGWWLFLWTTAVGILPITILSVVLGDRLLEASWIEWSAAAVAILLVACAVRWIRDRSVGRASK